MIENKERTHMITFYTNHLIHLQACKCRQLINMIIYLDFQYFTTRQRNTGFIPRAMLMWRHQIIIRRQKICLNLCLIFCLNEKKIIYFPFSKCLWKILKKFLVLSFFLIVDVLKLFIWKSYCKTHKTLEKERLFVNFSW